MLNKAVIMGRFTADPEIKMVNGATPVCNFSIACQRDIKKDDGTRDTDFIDCSAWRGTADFIAKNFVKGQWAVVVGRIQTKKWLETEGETRYRTDILVESVYFCGAKNAPAPGQQPTANPYGNYPAFDEIPEPPEDLPFLL